MNHIKIIAASIVLLGFSNLALAASSKVVSCDSKSDLDFGNATGQQSSACHTTPYWQRLGTKWNADSKKSETDLATNDGVSWKTSTDGVNWEDNGSLTAGGLVQFQFDVTRATTGNHKYDQLKSWVDWDQNGSWSEDETIIAKKWWKNENSEGVATKGSKKGTLNRNNDLSTWRGLGTQGSQNRSDSTGWKSSKNRWKKSIFNSNDTTATYFSSTIKIPVLDALKDIWLRARVVCENSLENHADNMNLIATGFQDQGEVEDYKLRVAKVAVPEPSTLFIFAIGLLGLATRKKVLSK